MRKVLLVIGMSAFAFTANAQWEKGSILATGNLGFSSASSEITPDGGDATDLSSGSTFNIGLTGGYFIMDNVAVGLGIGYGMGSTTDEVNDIESSTTQLAYGVFGRYYMPYTDKFSMFGALNIAMGSGSFAIDGDNVTETSSFTAGLGVGAAYFVTDNFFLEANYGFLGYSSTNTTMDIGQPTEAEMSMGEFGLDLDLSTFIFGLGILF